MRLIFAAAVVALVFVPAAFAQGGSPSQAYPLTFGKQFNGDTFRAPSDGRSKSEFSSVALKAGDFITLDWSQPIGGYNWLALLPPDTNDNNWGGMAALVARGPSSTGGDEFKLSILRSGIYYFQVSARDQYAGAYAITVHVRRGVKTGDLPSAARRAVSGHNYRGDVSNHVPDNYGQYREFWKVRLHAGDRMKVGWSQPLGGAISLTLLPVGTNNGNYLNLSSLTVRGPTANGHDAFSFVATRTGWYYLDFQARTPGAYSFALTVRHR